ncbi:hypothetical protein NMG60_11017230 [Bertholletia excelsa]
MSFDSDDLDEDELLQAALKEQAQPDSGDRKQPSKPAEGRSRKSADQRARNSNLTSKAQHRPKAQRPQSMDDDEDSEVDMLSISSGDEEEPKDQGSLSGSRARSGGRAGKDDDGSWDGGEPDCWKRVNEAELARRVREMRETRAVPVATKSEQKPSAIRKGLNNLQSFPRGMECIDPLGLGIIDNKTLRLITERSDSSPTKDSLDSDLRERLLYFSEKFDPKLFLSRIHQHTSAADMEAGALALKADLEGRTQQKKQLVKENFDCFVSCKTTIDDIESKLKRIEEDPEGSGTTQLVNCIEGVSSRANRAFGPLFERQAQAEKIRSVQGMLQRFRTLFNLPSAIRESISKGEYDLAVREYRKAKSIDLPSHVSILKRLFEEVEKLMHEFKGMLYKSMEDPQIDLTKLESIVRLLVELEPDSDPVWHYLNIQNRRIQGLLVKCTLDHESTMEIWQNEMREKALADAKWKELQQKLDLSLDIDYSQSIDISGAEIDILRRRYICRLTAVLTHHIPPFWKVALSVSSGKFAKSSQVAGDSSVTSANKNEEKIGDGKYLSHSLDEVAAMIRSTVSAYESKVQSTFCDFEESNVLCPYMRDAIEEISKACRAFEAKEAAPPIAVVALRVLQSESTKIYILRLSSWMRATIEEMSKEESWVPVSVLERNRSPYTISSLPLAFHSIVASAMDQINWMIQSLRSEATKSEDMAVQLQEIQESVRLGFLNCLLDFAGNLELIGGDLAQHRSNEGSPHLQNVCPNDLQEKSSDPLPGSVTDPHQQLLMVLSNIGYCKDELSTELYNKYQHIWLQSRGRDEEDRDMQDLIMSFSGLEEKVLELYTYAKANLIRTAATNYLLDSGIQWGGAPPVKGVRDAAVELLHTLVAVHAEVFSGCKPLLDKALGILVEGLIDCFLSLFHENKTMNLGSLDANGFCQLMLELEYFETILNPYFTNEARYALKSLQGLLLEKATESATESIETPSHNRRAVRGSEDALSDDRQQGMTVSPDDLILSSIHLHDKSTEAETKVEINFANAVMTFCSPSFRTCFIKNQVLAQQCSSELLQLELERTRINSSCFVESFC